MEQEPVVLIVEALTAGMAAGGQAAATSAVKDAYASLKALVKQRFAGRPLGEAALDELERRPEEYRGAVKAQLDEAGVGDDGVMLAQAHRLLSLVAELRPAGPRITVRDSSQFQIGDYAVMVNRSEYGETRPT